MFELERFVEDCRAARAADATHKAVREVVARGVSEPGSVLKSLGEPRRAGIQKLHHSAELTILNVVWAPRMTIFPHNHRMWAVIGIYTGREDNIFWRRVPDGNGGRIEAAERRGHHPFGDQPDCAPHRGDPCLRRRFFRDGAQRMGPGNAQRAALRRAKDAALFRGRERA